MIISRILLKLKKNMIIDISSGLKECAFDAEMDVYGKNWKRSELKMKEFTEEYYNYMQNINK